MSPATQCALKSIACISMLVSIDAYIWSRARQCSSSAADPRQRCSRCTGCWRLRARSSRHKAQLKASNAQACMGGHVLSHWKYCAGIVGSLRSTHSLMLQSFCSAPDAIMARRGLQATASTASQCPSPSASLLSLPGIFWTSCITSKQSQLLPRYCGGSHTAGLRAAVSQRRPSSTHGVPWAARAAQHSVTGLAALQPYLCIIWNEQTWIAGSCLSVQHYCCNSTLPVTATQDCRSTRCGSATRSHPLQRCTPVSVLSLEFNSRCV